MLRRLELQVNAQFLRCSASASHLGPTLRALWPQDGSGYHKQALDRDLLFELSIQSTPSRLRVIKTETCRADRRASKLWNGRGLAHFDKFELSALSRNEHINLVVQHDGNVAHSGPNGLGGHHPAAAAAAGGHPPAATPGRRTQEGPSLLHLVTSYLVECSLTFTRSLAPALLSDAVTTATDTIATDLARQTSSVSDEPIPATAHRDEATATTKRAAPHDRHAPQRSDSKQRARS